MTKKYSYITHFKDEGTAAGSSVYSGDISSVLSLNNLTRLKDFLEKNQFKNRKIEDIVITGFDERL